MANSTDPEGDIGTIFQCAQDILRWCLQIAFSRRISVDRKMDMIRHAEKIIEIVRKLG